MVEFDYDKTLNAARMAAEGLKPILGGRILGTRLSSFQFGCGTISHLDLEAVEVVPAGREKRYEGQVGFWYLWYVNMRHVGQEKGCNYSTGLGDFIPVTDIRKMFGDAFKGLDLERLSVECSRRSCVL